MKLLGGILLALGILALAYQGFTYTQKEKVVDLGPVEITREQTKRVPLPPIIGVVAIVAGGLLLYKGGGKA